MKASGNACFDHRLNRRRITEARQPIIDPAELNQLVHIALSRWCAITGWTSRYWLRGYCASFAETLRRHLGSAAHLASVVANDAVVHHIVVRFGEIVIDAEGACAPKALLDRLNRQSQLYASPLRALRMIPFESEHVADIASAPEAAQKVLLRCLKLAKTDILTGRTNPAAQGRPFW
jgi:hypothetical protein